MKKKAIYWTLAGTLLAIFVVEAAQGVTFALSQTEIKPGESVLVTFNKPLPKEGEKYWITVIPASMGDDQWGDWKYVDAGVKEVSVTGPATVGKFEVRLHDRYSELPYHVVYRQALTVKSASATAITFTLAQDSIAVGAKPKVTFNMPLPKEGEKYWITVIPANLGDDQWGDWKYVDAGVSSVELNPVAEAGKYEVRLHDRYSELAYHVVYRLPLTVK